MAQSRREKCRRWEEFSLASPFFTTGYFTDSAKNRARKPGCKPVELVDGEKLVEILEKHEFGLTPTKTYQVDYGLLGNYEKEKKKD